MIAFLAGLALGAASSGHCAAMCGPLVVSVGRTLRPPTRGARLRHVVLYHLGRLAAYGLLAIAAGSGGSALSHAGLGRVLAIAVAALLLDRAFGFAWFTLPRSVVAAYSRTLGRAASTSISRIRDRTFAGPIIAGSINGVLPCGLVYAALTAAAASGTVMSAVALMAGFGLGTAPILIALSVWSSAVPVRFRPVLRRLAPVALAITAAVLIFRAFAPIAGGSHNHHADAPVQHISTTRR